MPKHCPKTPVEESTGTSQAKSNRVTGCPGLPSGNRLAVLGTPLERWSRERLDPAPVRTVPRRAGGLPGHPAGGVRRPEVEGAEARSDAGQARVRAARPLRRAAEP